MKQLERVEKALTKLVLDQPFFATLAMRLDMKEMESIDTFATDGKNLFINPKWCAELSNDEIRTVLAHEVLHCALGHLWRMPQSGNHQVWNEAIDHETNWELEEFNQLRTMGYRGQSVPFPFPKYGKLMDDRFRGIAAEKIYRTLMDEYQENKMQQQGMGDIIPYKQEEKEQLKEEWEKAIIQAANVEKNQGKLPQSIERLVKKLTKSTVDWRTILRDCLSDVAHEDWSFQKANERYIDNDFILPSLHNEKVGKLVFAIDTSGSITQKILEFFISEAQFALDELLPESLEIVYCDTEIHGIDIYEPGDTIKEKILGGGGTNFCPVFEHYNKMENQPKVLVYMSDLYGTFPAVSPEYPVLWITDTNEKTPFGEIIKVEI